jgi:hypothetical protein
MTKYYNRNSSTDEVPMARPGGDFVTLASCRRRLPHPYSLPAVCWRTCPEMVHNYQPIIMLTSRPNLSPDI